MGWAPRAINRSVRTLSAPAGPLKGWRLRRRISRALPNGRGPDLTACELSLCSQNGEDGVLQAIIDRIGAGSRYFVEFGVGPGQQGNCVALADWYGWNGLFMESDRDDFELLQDKYAAVRRIRTRHAVVTASNVESLLIAEGVPERPDIISIDIDGNDYWVWQQLEAIQPRVVVIEYNANLPLEATLVMPRDDAHRWDGTDYFGASLGAYCKLAAAKGYELVHTETTGVNAFFVAAREIRELPHGEAVPRRRANYLGRGIGHTPDPARRRFLDLASGQLVSVPRRPPAES